MDFYWVGLIFWTLIVASFLLHWVSNTSYKVKEKKDE
jgi:hypothetical protein